MMSVLILRELYWLVQVLLSIAQMQTVLQYTLLPDEDVD